MGYESSATNDPGHDATIAPTGAVDPSDAHGLIGQVIAERYRADAVLGEGGMGAVLRCHHLGLKRDVALKILHAELGRNKEISARFAREAHSASRLEHPNCVHVMDFGEWRYDPVAAPMQYLAMQLLDGHELTNELGQPLPPARAVDLILQLLAGLEHAHAHGIVHRDLKPENVFVSHDHEGKELLKLVDFGIAKIVSGDGAQDGMTRAGLIFGTPKYMSPEQGMGGDIDERTDIYSAGVILYEMLAGHAPFDAENVVDLIRKQINEDPPPLPAHVPRALSAIVNRMLAKLANERYLDVASVRAALREIRPQLEDTLPTATVSTGIARTIAGTTRTLSGGAQDVAQVVRRMTLQGQAFARGLDPRRRRIIGIGAGGLGFVLLLALVWPSGDDGEDEASASQASVDVALPSWLQAKKGKAAPDKVELPRPLASNTSGASKSEVAEVDQLIDEKNLAGAATRLNQLIDQYPEDARLWVRRGRILARSKKSDDKAIDAYEKAVDVDPTIVGDPAVLAEILAAMKHPKVRDKAVDLAVRKLGEAGHPFLLDLVNDDKAVLGYVDRQRALEALATSKASAAKVDKKLNLALDLWQAGQSLEPCEAFSTALQVIEAEPSEYYLGTLARVTVPSAPKDASALQRTLCEGLPKRKEQVQAKLVELYAAVPSNKWEVPAAYAQKKKKRRGWFR